MSTLEIELQDLREKNNELVKKVQHWKMTAAQREIEKLDLMKENNDLRMKLSRIRSGGAAHARKLDAEIQAASKQALSHLVQASSAVTRTVQLAKTYMQDRQELETSLPRWSSIGNTPNSDKVHRVPPMLIGGQSIQPVVSLSRTMVNVNNMRTNRSPNNRQAHTFPQRALPMHLLQDLYIPLTRIDANDLPDNNIDMDTDADETNANNSTEDLELGDGAEQSLQESQNVSDSGEFDESRRLDVVAEDMEPEDEPERTPRARADNPLEGPSWMLDAQSKRGRAKSRVNLEPDSTTEGDRPPASPPPAAAARLECDLEPGVPPPPTPREFSPTVRRRKRAQSPAAPPTPPTPHSYSPRPPSHRRNSTNGRILKVLVSKLRLDDSDVSPPKRPSLAASPPRRTSQDGSPVTQDNSPTRRQGRGNSSKGHGRDAPQTRRQRSAQGGECDELGSPARAARTPDLYLSFDAPSPNGATTSHLIVSESTDEAGGSGEPAAVAARRPSRHGSRAARDTSRDGRDGRSGSAGADSDSGSGGDAVAEGRTRRPRKAVTYKEKPLNRKMRR